MIRTKVKLAVYDLSRGLAVQLSEAILGQRIDGIWHTGVIVYGLEYFFGGGIQMLPEGQFGVANGMQPTITELGETEITREIFHEYVQSINHLFTQQTYDLIRNNCNNFSDTIARFLLGQGIPSHIVDLPRIVFSTPGGMMLRPMIENMQNNIQQQGMANNLDPFGAASNRVNNNSSFSPTNFNTIVEPSQSHPPSVTICNTPKRYPIYNPTPSPLVSADNDSTMLISMLNKLLKIPMDENNILTSEDMKSLEDTIQNMKLTSTSPNTNNANTNIINESFSLEAFIVIGKILENYPKYEMTSLFLLRVMVLSLNHTLDSSIPVKIADILRYVFNKVMKGQSAFSSISSMVMALCTISNTLSTKGGYQWFFSEFKLQQLSDDQILLNQSQSHSIATPTHPSPPPISFTIDSFVEMIITNLNHNRVEVRQLAAAILYNITIACTEKEGEGWKLKTSSLSTTTLATTNTATNSNSDNDSNSNSNRGGDNLHEMAVQILCGILEGLVEEVDATCRTRRLMTVSRIIRSCGPPADSLFHDLGFGEMLLEHSKRSDISDKERELIRNEIGC